MKKLVSLAALGLVLAAPAAAQEVTPADVAEGNNAFAFDLYHALRGEDGEANRFFSPFSITAAFGMVQVGARGDTEEQIRETLHFPADGPALHGPLGTLLDQTAGASAPQPGMTRRLGGQQARGPAPDDDAGAPLEGEAEEEAAGYEVRIANAMWLEQDFPYSEATFLEPVARAYGPAVKRVDFRNAARAQVPKVNAWAADHTNDKIRKVITEDDVDEDTRFLIANAIWFKGAWEHPFVEIEDRSEVSDDEAWRYRQMWDQPFHTFGGEVEVDLMMLQDTRLPLAWIDPDTGDLIEPSFETAGRDKIELLELPYEGGDLSMVVILPPEGPEGFAAVEEQLDADTLGRWLGQARRQVIASVRLPKFKLAPETLSLKETLQGMGMVEPFQPVTPGAGADFSAMLDPAQRTLYITFVKHKAFVEVNEKSTEAAAVTVIGGAETTSVPTHYEARFRADRPFVFLIRDRRTATEENPLGTILFLGRLLDPSRDQG